MIAAAALVAASAASAQVTTTNIPFAFKVGSNVMAAGKYHVDLRGLGGTVVIRDAAWHSVTVMPSSHMDTIPSSVAKLVFQCNRGNCSLVQIWPGGSGLAATFKGPKPTRGEEASLSVVTLFPAE